MIGLQVLIDQSMDYPILPLSVDRLIYHWNGNFL